MSGLDLDRLDAALLRAQAAAEEVESVIVVIGEKHPTALAAALGVSRETLWRWRHGTPLSGAPARMRDRLTEHRG